MVLVDTNYIIRYFSKELDEQYQKSKKSKLLDYEILSFDKDIEKCLK